MSGNERDHVLVECGHTICAQCKDRVNASPVCRQPIVICREKNQFALICLQIYSTQ